MITNQIHDGCLKKNDSKPEKDTTEIVRFKTTVHTWVLIKA